MSFSFTCGYTQTPTVNSGNSYSPLKTLWGFGPFTMPASGYLQSCSVWVSASPTGTMQLGVYAPQAANQPGALLANTAAFALAGLWNLNKATTTNPLILAGTVIWMGAEDTVTDATVADAPAGLNLLSGAVGTGTLVNPFGTAAVSNTSWATGIYATFQSCDPPPGMGNAVGWTYG